MGYYIRVPYFRKSPCTRNALFKLVLQEEEEREELSPAEEMADAVAGTAVGLRFRGVRFQSLRFFVCRGYLRFSVLGCSGVWEELYKP